MNRYFYASLLVSMVAVAFGAYAAIYHDNAVCLLEFIVAAIAWLISAFICYRGKL